MAITYNWTTAQLEHDAAATPDELKALTLDALLA